MAIGYAYEEEGTPLEFEAVYLEQQRGEAEGDLEDTDEEERAEASSMITHLSASRLRTFCRSNRL